MKKIIFAAIVAICAGNTNGMDADIQSEVKVIHRAFPICRGLDEGIITIKVLEEADSYDNNVEISSLVDGQPFEVCSGIEVLKKKGGILDVCFSYSLKRNMISYINILVGPPFQPPVFSHIFYPSIF
jgi:hypothetical protein